MTLNYVEKDPFKLVSSHRKKKSFYSHNFTAVRPPSHLCLLSLLFHMKKEPLFCCLGAEGRWKVRKEYQAL